MYTDLDRADIVTRDKTTGHDLPNTFAHLNREKDAALAADPDGLHKQAIANLADVTDVSVAEHDVRGLKLVAVGGSYFAAEKVLDAPFSRSITDIKWAPRSVPASA